VALVMNLHRILLARLSQRFLKLFSLFCGQYFLFEPFYSVDFGPVFSSPLVLLLLVCSFIDELVVYYRRGKIKTSWPVCPSYLVNSIILN